MNRYAEMQVVVLCQPSVDVVLRPYLNPKRFNQVAAIPRRPALAGSTGKVAELGRMYYNP